MGLAKASVPHDKVKVKSKKYAHLCNLHNVEEMVLNTILVGVSDGERYESAFVGGGPGIGAEVESTREALQVNI